MYKKCFYLLLIIGPFISISNAQLKKLSIPNLYSEADIYTDNWGNWYSTTLTVNFTKKTLDLPSGVIRADIKDILIPEVKNYFTEVQQRYGKFSLEKEFGNAVWGDTIGTHIVTKAKVTLKDLSQFYKLKFEKLICVDSLIIELKRTPYIRGADKPFIAIPAYDPNDYTASAQWALVKIEATKAWDITHGSNLIKIGISDLFSDTDPDSLHNELRSGKIVYNPLNLCQGHGQTVAGCAAALTDNGFGISSIGFNSSLMFTLSGPAAIDELRIQGADIINCSWASFWSLALNDAVYNALNTGIIVTAAAGNSQNSVVRYGLIPVVIYPAALNFPSIGKQVIAVSATNNIGGIESFGFPPEGTWNYSPGTNPIEDPTNAFIDMSAPGVNVKILHGNEIDNYSLEGRGTSLAAATVAGTIALMKSVHPSLTPELAYNILINTAEKVGTDPYDANGWNQYLGYGRINAYQALLLTLAYSNKSHSYSATAHNNNHTLERGYFGRLHEVFHSGGEIFYRRSSNNGSTWEITSRLSSGNGSNDHPSIVAGVSGTDILCATWQRKLTDTQYEIYTRFSSNMGSTWITTPSPFTVTISNNQSPANAGAGATPVVASYFRNGSEGTPSYLLVYATTNGLYYRTATTYSSGWSAASVVPGSSGSNSTIWYPSLTSYNSQGYTVNLIYDNKTNVYSQIFNENGTWNTRVQVSSTGINRYSSIAVDYLNNTLAAWSRWNGSNYIIRFRKGNADGTWGTWNTEWTAAFDSYHPAITYYNKGGTYPYGIDILWHNSLNQIRQTKYTGTGNSWLPTSLLSRIASNSALFANLTHERQNTTLPLQMWTNQSSPYSITYNSDFLPKEELMTSRKMNRAIEVGDESNNTGLRIELSQPEINLIDGQKIIVPFKEYDYSAKLNLSLTDVFDYIQTEVTEIPDNAVSISFDVNINTSIADTLDDGSLNTNKNSLFKDISFSLAGKEVISQNDILLTSHNLSDNSGVHKFSRRVDIGAGILKNKKISFIPRVKIKGEFKESNLQFSLVNVFVEDTLSFDGSVLTESSNGENVLTQNFPNPFNPITNISYNIKEAGFVNITVYDILGKQVAVLANEAQEPGFHTVEFDASNLGTGIYLYTLKTNQFISSKKMLVIK